MGVVDYLRPRFGSRPLFGAEDAWVFAECVKRGATDRYHALRWPVDRRVVKRVRWLTRAMVGEARWSRGLRRVMVPAALRIGGIRNAMLRTLTGLDHELPF